MYGGFENFYNREMPVKYYRDTADFFDRMMKKYARPYYTENNIVLDCGCGTGCYNKGNQQGPELADNYENQ